MEVKKGEVVMFGRGEVTSKSVCVWEFVCQLELELETNLRCETRGRTALPCGTEVAARLAGVDVREGAWRCCRVGAGVLCVSELEVGEGGA